jgi:hypothetical protein
MSKKLFLVALAAIALAGLGLRTWVITEQRPLCPVRAGELPAGCFALLNGVNDALNSHYTSNQVADGHLFVDPFLFESTGEEEPSAGDPPLYTFFLASVSVFGGDSGQAHRLASAVLGTGTILAAGLLARRLRTPRAGLLAAGAVALYPMLWINDTMLLSESLYALVVVGVLWFAFTFAERPSARTAAVLGLFVGLASLTRGEAVLLVPLIILPLAWGARRALDGWRPAAGLAVLASVVAGVVMLPWIAYNIGRFEEPVFLTAGNGAVLNAASCDETYYGDRIGYYGNCFEGALPSRDQMDESQRDNVAREQALDYISAHKSRLPVVTVARVGRMWDVFRPAQNVRLNWEIEGRGKRASELGLISYYALLPFAAAGLVAVHRARRPLSPFIGIALAVTATAALTFGLTRYRAPVDLELAILAGLGADLVLAALLARRGPDEHDDADGTDVADVAVGGSTREDGST